MLSQLLHRDSSEWFCQLKGRPLDRGLPCDLEAGTRQRPRSTTAALCANAKLSYWALWRSGGSAQEGRRGSVFLCAEVFPAQGTAVRWVQGREYLPLLPNKTSVSPCPMHKSRAAETLRLGLEIPNVFLASWTMFSRGSSWHLEGKRRPHFMPPSPFPLAPEERDLWILVEDAPASIPFYRTDRSCGKESLPLTVYPSCKKQTWKTRLPAKSGRESNTWEVL